MLSKVRHGCIQCSGHSQQPLGIAQFLCYEAKKHELEIDFKAYTNGSLECSLNSLIKHQTGLPFLLQIGDVFVPFPNLPSCRHLPLLAI